MMSVYKGSITEIQSPQYVLVLTEKGGQKVYYSIIDL